MTAALPDLGLVEVAALVASRSISPTELVDACLARIDRMDGDIRAFVVVSGEARSAAAAAEREIGDGAYRGPLHGVPVAIKDIVDVAGLSTRAGSAVLADAPASASDAPVVARLKEAGAVILGKTATHEFAFSVFTPPTRNPWDLDRVPGGSSGGSAAAVAAGMAFAAIGTDTGGSIRIPAACCGVVGLKPTYGRVPKAGVIPLSWSLDHVGPIARRAEDAAAVLQAIAGPDAGDPTAAAEPVPNFSAGIGEGVNGLRIGVPDGYFGRRLTPTVAAAVSSAIDRLAAAGAVIESVSLPALDRALDVNLLTILAEAAAYHRGRFPDRPDEYGEDVRAALALGARISAIDFLQAQRLRRMALGDALAAFSHVNVLVTPTLPTEAPAIGQDTILYPDGAEDALTSLVRFTCPFNQTGLPAVSIPIGGGSDGLPVGLQIVAPPFDEALAIRVAVAVQSWDGLLDRRPPLVRTSS